MIEDYFDFLKKVANKNPSVKKFRLIREFIGVNSGFIRFVLKLRDDSELHVFEYIDLITIPRSLLRLGSITEQLIT